MYGGVHDIIKIGQGIFELHGSENWLLPLTWLVALTTVQHYNADCDNSETVRDKYVLIANH